MSYGHQPKFSSRALAELRALGPRLQEAILDEVDRLIESVPVPTVAQRLEGTEAIHDFSRVVGGTQHLVFRTTALDVAAREMRIIRVGQVARPDPD